MFDQFNETICRHILCVCSLSIDAITYLYYYHITKMFQNLHQNWNHNIHHQLFAQLILFLFSIHAKYLSFSFLFLCKSLRNFAILRLCFYFSRLNTLKHVCNNLLPSTSNLPITHWFNYSHDSVLQPLKIACNEWHTIWKWYGRPM